MTSDEKLEKDILEYVARWIEDPERPSDRAPFIFPETLDDLPSAKSSHVSPRLAEERVRTKIDELVDAKLLSHTDIIGDDSFQITRLGFTQLERYRDMVGLRRLKRGISQVLDKTFSSIFVPIAVSALTVVVMRFLGLEK